MTDKQQNAGSDILDIFVPNAERYFYTSEIVSQLHKVILSEDLGDHIRDYEGLVALLDRAQETDGVLIKLSNSGGSVDIGLLLCNAIKNCKAQVLIEVVGYCASMGAIIALCGDDLIMRQGSMLMFHHYTSSPSGKGAELKLRISIEDEWYAELLNCFCTPFLTDKEVKRLMDDSDVYIKGWQTKSLNKRIARHFK